MVKTTAAVEKNSCDISLLLSRAHNVRVPRVRDGHAAHSEVLSTRRSKLHVVPRVRHHVHLREHGVILELRLAQEREVVGKDDQLGCRKATRRKDGRGGKEKE